VNLKEATYFQDKDIKIVALLSQWGILTKKET
jgi:hypothetical protein